LLKPLDLKLQVIFFLSNLFITSFHTYLTCGGFIIGSSCDVQPLSKDG
jgi:hypothetical protein